MNPNRFPLRVCVIGPEGSGKSTLVGHLLYQCGVCDDRFVGKMEVLAHEMGRPDSKFAFIPDKLHIERVGGFTSCIKFFLLLTKHQEITLIDTPGRRHFFKNLLTGISGADVAVLVLPINPSDEDWQFVQDLLYILTSFGVHQLIVAVCIFDLSLDVIPDAYELLCDNFSALVRRKANALFPTLSFVPISGLHGEGLSTFSGLFPFYDGLSLHELLCGCNPIERRVQEPFRMPITEVMKIIGVGTILLGKIDSGVIHSGDTMTLAPSGMEVTIDCIESFYRSVDSASAGDTIGIRVPLEPSQIKRGFVLGSFDHHYACQLFEAQVFVVSDVKIQPGFNPVLVIHTLQTHCVVESVNSCVRNRGESGDCSSLCLKDVGIVRIRVFNPICIEPFHFNKFFGRFLLRDGNRVVAMGIVKSVLSHQFEAPSKLELL